MCNDILTWCQITAATARPVPQARQLMDVPYRGALARALGLLAQHPDCLSDSCHLFTKPDLGHC